MRKEDVRQSLFEVWEDTFCIGNGGIVSYPDGKTYFVTAKHLAFRGEKPRNLMLHSATGRRLTENEIHFQGIQGRDLALAQAPSSLRGLSIASFFETGSYISMLGSLYRELFAFNVRIVYAGKELFAAMPMGRREGIQSSKAQTFHYIVTNPDNPIFPGTSGSLLLDRDNKVIGIQSGTTWGEKFPFGVYNFGEVLSNKRERS